MTADYAVQRVLRHYPDLHPDQVRTRLWYSTYVNLDRQYMYFEVPKAACTTMKQLIHSLENLPPIPPFRGAQPEVRRDMFIHVRSEFKMDSLVDLDDRTQEYVLNSPEFFRFTVVRDPYTRLRSAWRDKVRPCVPGYEYLYHQIKGGLPAGGDPSSFITLREFVAAIERDDMAVANSHWRMQTAQLFQPAMNLNHIGRMESLHDTVATFGQRAGFAETRLPAPANPSWGGDTYDQALADTVHAMYERDFRELGYDRDSWKTAQARPDTVSHATFLEEITERNIVIGHLYTERADLRDRLRKLEQRTAEPNPDDCRTADFDTLFDRYIGPIDGWIGKPETACLYEMAKAVVAGCVVEVGSYRGRSTAALAFGVAAGANVPVYAVDPHEPFRGQFGGEFGPVDRGRFMRTMIKTGVYRHVRLINLSSEAIARDAAIAVGLLFIDGDHRLQSVKRDFECWAARLMPHAAVVLEDAANPASGPGRLARQLAKSGAFSVETIIGKMVCLRRVDGVPVRS